MAITSLRRIAFLTLVTLSCVGVIKASEPPQQLNDEDRGRFISEIRNYKHEFLTRDLNLTRDQ
ncbi:MAG: hypothetical protein K2F63_00240, partial [Muribaculaceae bacterium]|nr:hypothetical protein [Muribaculaceae bacterium]